MNNEIANLTPKLLWENFCRLNEVPRPSKKEERVIQFILDFAASLSLEAIQDEIGNIVVKKPATKGLENRETIVIQSHLDMVHQKNNDTIFDFDKEEIQMKIEGDWVKAKGTTLGADNGIGVATMMAILASTNLPHPSIEALFTIDEETGMTGAKHLDPKLLSGNILLNLDTEEDDEICIGCAGGVDITATQQYDEATIATEDKIGVHLNIKGLEGGHSGVDIHKGLGNANKIINRILFNISKKYQINVASIEGGNLRNAIPRESEATIVIQKSDQEAFEESCKTAIKIIQEEQYNTDPNLLLEINFVEPKEKVLPQDIQTAILNTLMCANNGVYRMSPDVEGLVETSNNIAKVSVSDGNAKIECLTRSSVTSSRIDLSNSLTSAFELGGFKVSLNGEYSGWKPNPDSKILKVIQESYKKINKEDAHVMACHAGLECGIIGQHYPEMDMVSFGPTINGAHSPDERVSISSVQKYWKLVEEVLQNTP